MSKMVLLGNPHQLQSNCTTYFTRIKRYYVMLRFFYQQMHLLLNIYDIKIHIKKLLYSHCYMFQSVQTIIRESTLSLVKVTFLWI